MTDNDSAAPEETTDEAQAEAPADASEVALGEAPTQPSAESAEKPPKSGFTYRTVTRYWPRIAVGLVAVVGILEWVVGGITSSGALEFYIFAWATTTGGLWFMFEKAEKALS